MYNSFGSKQDYEKIRDHQWFLANKVAFPVGARLKSMTPTFEAKGNARVFVNWISDSGFVNLIRP